MYVNFIGTKIGHFYSFFFPIAIEIKMDDNKWVSCPYNEEHRVLELRLPYHMIRCKKNYKGPPLETCPFNATHLVPQGTLQEHYTECISYFHAMRERMEIQQAKRN